VTGQNGGAAFVFIYIFFVLIIGAPVMIAEISLGRASRRNPVGAYRAFAPKSFWYMAGMLGVVTGLGILSYYSVIAGWTIGYFVKTITGAFSQTTTADESVEIFQNFASSSKYSIGYLFAFIVLTAFVIIKGISAGIERWTKILMPILFLLFLALTFRSMTLPGAVKGLSFYLKPDFSKVNIGIVIMALGQALFSLSLGMGAMITYGSYLSKKENVHLSAGYVCFFDTTIAILAGLMIFPALFSAGLNPAGGAGLVFHILPTLFATIPGGSMFGAGFFLLLAIAALTSTISLLEAPVAYLVDEKHWSRKNATIAMACCAFLLGVPSALSNGANSWLSQIPLIGMGFLEFANIILGNYFLISGTLLLSIYVAYVWGVRAVKNMDDSSLSQRLHSLWSFLIRFVCPIAILGIFAYIIVTGNYF
jgi:NSS family neurotransmitter:Na+ symporter